MKANCKVIGNFCEISDYLRRKKEFVRKAKAVLFTNI